MTTLLIDAVRRCALVWRAGQHRSHYWLTPASLMRIQRIAQAAQLVRIYYTERTYVLTGGRYE